MRNDALRERIARLLAKDIARALGVRIKADDFGTLPIADRILQEVACYLDEEYLLFDEEGVTLHLTQGHAHPLGPSASNIKSD